MHGVAYSGFETLYASYSEYSGYSGSTGDPFQVRSCPGRRWKTADREQTFVVENNMDQFPGAIARHCSKTAKVHQKRTIAIEHDHCLFRHAKSEAQPRRRRQSHRVLQIKEIRAV